MVDYRNILVEKLEYLPEISKQLQLSIREDGYVLDDASVALKGIRQGISRTESCGKGICRRNC